jgi:hypothetical protein
MIEEPAAGFCALSTYYRQYGAGKARNPCKFLVTVGVADLHVLALLAIMSDGSAHSRLSIVAVAVVPYREEAGTERTQIGSSDACLLGVSVPMERHEQTTQFAFFCSLERLERSMERCCSNQPLPFQGRGTLKLGSLQSRVRHNSVLDRSAR